jgi:cyclopropane-fatty-acyl-phospholipid synthase
MASQDEIAATYDYLDEFWRCTFGDVPDITAALFDGDTAKSLTQAQLDKHAYILNTLEFAPGFRVLDIGCGWGGLLRTIGNRGGRGVGWTLSPRQVAACRRAGLDVTLTDWKTADLVTVGPFDAIACVGAFEHFCSENEYIAGKQGTIYREFFRRCAELVEGGRRLYLQTMLWGAAVPEPATISVHATPGSDDYILGLLRYFYPGSWLPSGLDQIECAASPWFSIVATRNGRLDYIATMQRWGQAAARLSPRQLVAVTRVLRHAVRDRDLRYRLRSVRHSSNLECFRRRLMDHERITLRRTVCGAGSL